MAILHKNISAEGDIHNPKWFSGANNGDVAWRNELGVLESTDELVLPAALDFVDGSVAPPTSNSGDIYVLSSGASVNAGWGTVSLGDWVRYDGTTWNVITPQKSSLCYNETTDALNSYDGSTWSAIGSGGGGGSTIYTADGALTGNRTVDLGGSNLSFKNSSGTNSLLTLSDNAFGIISNTLSGIFAEWNSNSRLKISNNSLFVETGDFRVRNYAGTLTRLQLSQSGGAGKLAISNSVGSKLNWDTNDFQIAGSFTKITRGANVKAYFSNTFTILGNNSTSRISSEDISLQGSTLIKGIGTAGSSALSIYDNDTTPNKLWDFLDNGNVNLGGDSVINQDSNVLQFSNINSIGGLKFNGTSNNGIGLNLANGSNDFDFVVAGSSNTLIGTGSLGLLVGGSWAMQISQAKEISIGQNFEPVSGYDLSVDKAYFDTEITIKSPAGIMQFNGYRTHNIDPSTATFPNDKDFGVHKNTSSGNVFLAFNDGGTIKKVQLT